MNAVEPPLNVTQLNERLTRVASELGLPVARARVMLCTMIVSQMLPDAAVVKGGMGVKFRFGEIGTRATSDLDVSTRERGEEFEAKFRELLTQGWGSVPASKGQLRKDPNAPSRRAFTGSLRALATHDPGLSRPEYVMHPYRVTLAFLGTAWAGLDVEVSDPEVDADAHHEHGFDEQLVDFGARFGFGELQPVTLVDLEYQMAQKIHAVTDPNYDRAHDLVDLQLLCAAKPDLSKLRDLCERTFRWRSEQDWPPLPLIERQNWEQAYRDARAETLVEGQTPVLEDVLQARVWLEKLLNEVLGH